MARHPGPIGLVAIAGDPHLAMQRQNENCRARRLHAGRDRVESGMRRMVQVLAAMLAVAGARGEEADVKGDEALEVATFAAGCFWCVEAVFRRTEGVRDVVCGYTGGTTPNPTYRQVSTGTTGHAEAVRVTFDPARISYRDLLLRFWAMHDPTTPNRQGADVGTQYRSAVFVHTPAQRGEAEAVRAELDRSGRFPAPIVTEIAEAGPFTEAEPEHQDYFARNPSAAYCTLVIRPKIERLGLEP